MEEYKLIPQDVRARAGRLRIVAFNAGRQTHNVKVVKEAEDSEDAPLEIGGAKTAQPGATETATVRLRPGTYRIVCTIANHDDLGQYGELEVVP
jgi:plastocyanin